MTVTIPYRQILNELSFETESCKDAFLQKMKDILSVIDEMATIGFDLSLAYKKEILYENCFYGVKLLEWLRSHEPCNEDERKLRQRFLHLFMNKGLSLEELYIPNMALEILYRDIPLKIAGLSASYHLVLPSISFQNKEFKDEFKFKIKINEAINAENGDTELQEYEREIYSISQKSQISQIFDDNLKKVVKEIQSGEDILKHQNDIFTKLSFSTEAISQLKKMSKADFTKNGFPWICEILLYLNHAKYQSLAEGKTLNDIIGYGRGDFASTESGPTKGRYSSKHCFRWDDGTRRECWAHAKNIALNIRIYFNAGNSEEKIYIGHIGNPLPVSSGEH